MNAVIVAEDTSSVPTANKPETQNADDTPDTAVTSIKNNTNKDEHSEAGAVITEAEAKEPIPAPTKKVHDESDHDCEFDSDEDEDEDESEDEALQKEMELSFAKAEAEKRESKLDMQKLLITLQQKQPKPNANTKNKNIPITKISLSHKRHRNINSRKQTKHKLKKMLSKKRSSQIKLHRKTFGREDEYITSTKPKDQPNPKPNPNPKPKPKLEAKKPKPVAVVAAAKPAEVKEDDKDRGKDESADLEDDHNLEDLDYEALAATASKPVSKEIMKYLDIAADEEDAQGTVLKDSDDHFEKFGIVKNLLATKKDCAIDNKPEYQQKRAVLHQQLQQAEDEANLKLMETAFVDGKYRQMRQGLNALNADDNQEMMDGMKRFKSRNNEWQTKPGDYLSEDEEKNEYCVYNRQGEFNDICTIRMKIMEWRRMKQKASVVEEDNEEEKLRLKRVYRKEQMSRGGASADISQSNNRSMNDDSTISVLQMIRKNKNKPKPSLGKAGTDFSRFLDGKVKGQSSGSKQFGKSLLSGGTSFSMHSDKIQTLKNNLSRSRSQSNPSINNRRYVFGKENKSTTATQFGRKRTFSECNGKGNEQQNKRRKF